MSLKERLRVDLDFCSSCETSDSFSHEITEDFSRNYGYYL